MATKKLVKLGQSSVVHVWDRETIRTLLFLPENATILANGKPLRDFTVIRPFDEADSNFFTRKDFERIAQEEQEYQTAINRQN